MASKTEISNQHDGPDYLVAFACFECKNSFKRPAERFVLVRKCPNCGEKAVDLGRKFQPPKKNDAEKWATAKYLYENGFPYHSINPKQRYPEDLKGAKEFVVEFSDQCFRGFSISVKVANPEQLKNYTHKSVFVPWVPYENPSVPEDEI